jgi:cytochrome P450
MAEMATELLGLAAARRAEPRDDVVSMLAGVSEDGDALSEAELGMFLIQLLVAGNETTRNATSGGLVALAERPEQWQRLADDRSLVPSAVEETLRWTTPVTSFLRTAVRDTELSGVQVAAGDPVLLLYASANRDPREFGPEADRFDVGRNPNHHVAFGFGAHFCLGAALARAELAVMLDALLDRVERLEPAGPVERTGSSVINGIRRAPLRLYPR